MQAHIRSVGAYVPEKIVTNNDLAKTIDTNDEWIFSHTGIHERRVTAENQAASDLGYEAVKNALDNLKFQDPDGGELSGADIDLVLLATSTPDYLGLPSTACVVQDRIGANQAGAMDLVAACTGFIYGLETAKNYIVGGGLNNVLVVGAEVFSKIINWKDRSTCVLFGDGAGAVVVSRTRETSTGGIFSSGLGSQGDGIEHLLRPAGGTRTPYLPGITPEEDLYLHMNGRQVYLFAVGALTNTINRLLELNKLTMDEIDHVVPHQANKRIIEAACKRNGWPEEKFFMNIERFANTSAASIPIALHEMKEKGLLKRGDKVLTVGFGSGLTFGGNYFIW